MAENEIDKLSLSINVKDHDSAKKILQVSNAIRNLTNSLKGLDKVSEQIKSLQSVFAGIGAVGRSATKNVGTGKDVLKTATLNEDIPQQGQLPTENLKSVRENLKEARIETTKLKTEFEKLKQQKINVQMERTAKQIQGTGTEAKKTTGFFSKFVKSIGRIALYRAIRTALKEITQAMTEGIQNYAKYNAETNQAMSGVMNSTNQLKNTLGVTLGSIMQSLAPILENLAGLATDFFNNINMALASLQGKSTYSKAIKQNEDYAKSLDKVNGKLLSFDTFNTLATDNGSKGLFEEVAVPDQLNETASMFKEIFEVVDEIFNVFKEIFALAKDLFNLLKPVFEYVIKKLKTVVQNIKGVIQFIEGIVKILTGDFSGAWDLIGKGFQNMIDSIKKAFINLIEFLVRPFKAIGEVLSGQWQGISARSPSTPQILSFAGGGSFNSGDLFVADENGRAEMIWSNNNGGSGSVATQSQVESWVANGVAIAMANTGVSEIVLKVNETELGRVVANSNGFISATNRRNSNLKLI